MTSPSAASSAEFALNWGTQLALSSLEIPLLIDNARFDTLLKASDWHAKLAEIINQCMLPEGGLESAAALASAAGGAASAASASTRGGGRGRGRGRGRGNRGDAPLDTGAAASSASSASTSAAAAETDSPALSREVMERIAESIYADPSAQKYLDELFLPDPGMRIGSDSVGQLFCDSFGFVALLNDMAPFFPFDLAEFVINAEEDEDDEDAGFENEDSGGEAMPSPTPSVAVASTPAAFDYSLFDDENLLDEVLETSS